MKNLTPTKVRDLKPGDKVDLDCSLPFEYDEPLKEFEYGIVDEVTPETPNCFVIVFENLTAIALGPDYQLMVAT